MALEWNPVITVLEHFVSIRGITDEITLWRYNTLFMYKLCIFMQANIGCILYMLYHVSHLY